MRSLKACVLAIALATSMANASNINCSLGAVPCGNFCLNFSFVGQAVAVGLSTTIKGLIDTNIDGQYFPNLDTLKGIYEEQIGALRIQNQLLEQYLALLQQSALQEKKRAFLTNKFNVIQSIINDIEAVDGE